MVELPCRLSSGGISLEVLKKAEKEDCLIIRLVEIQGKTSSGILYFDANIKRIAETDMLEWENLSSVEVSGSMGVELKPFEIRTYKLLQA
jgi:alpha-mannosidase